MIFKNLASFIKIKQALIIGFLFCTSSLLFGTWVTAIPAIKVKFGFTDGTLGMSLLLSPLGAITGIFLSTYIFKKISVGKWLMVGYITLSCIMVLQVNAPNKYILWGCLYLFGICSFLNGVAANSTVTILEKKYNRLMMSTCHGMYSLGGALSAVLATMFFSIGITSNWQIIIVAIFVLTIIALNHPLILQHTTIIHNDSGLKFPNKTIIGISFICMVTFMAEGCVADWSAIYLKEIIQSPKAFISFGYAGFSIAMTVGRLNGDVFIGKVGAKKMVIIGSIVAAFGFLMVCIAHSIFIAVFGYVLVGLGCCCIVPVLFSAATNIPGVTTVQGFAMVTTGGLIGFLTGPSLIGFVSEKINLSNAMIILIVFALLAAFVAWRNKFLT
jgi:MFS family permease